MTESYYEGQDLEALADLRRYQAWIRDMLRPTGHVMEVGAGTGNFSHAYADDVDELHLVEPSQLAQVLEQRSPDRVTSNMAKAARVGKIFIDWSQNSRHKTTIAPYSMRAKDRPTVSTPVTWDEVADGAAGEVLSFETDDVLVRVAELGDLFEPTISERQELPSPN